MFNTLYLRIACNHLRITHLESGKERELHADLPFSSVRLLVAEFSIADRLISEAAQSLIRKRFMRLSLPPRMVIHPLERLEGDLSQVEERLLLELGKGCGAKKVVVHIGEVLDTAGVRAKLERPCA